MRDDRSDVAWAAVRGAEPDRMDRDGVVGLVGEVRRLRSVLDAVEHRAVRRLRQLEAAGASECAESVLVNHGGRSGRAARAAGERDELCNDAPGVVDALDDGTIGGEHVDAIAAAATDLPGGVRTAFLSRQDQLLARAARLGVDAFRRECRQLAKDLLVQSRHGAAEQVTASKMRRWVDGTTGMHHTHLELDPVRDAKLQATWKANVAASPGARGRLGADDDPRAGGHLAPPGRCRPPRRVHHRPGELRTAGRRRVTGSRRCLTSSRRGFPILVRRWE